MSLPTASESAKRLYDLFHTEFAGKKSGRYLISRDRFKTLIAKRDTLQNVVIDEAAAALREEYQYILIDLGDSLAVIPEEKVRGFRPVPAKLKF